MSSHQEIILCELPMLKLDIGNAAPYDVTSKCASELQSHSGSLSWPSIRLPCSTAISVAGGQQ
jgi:hypothetical protein